MPRLFCLLLFLWILPARAQTIMTIAGCGSAGYSGDGGPAINAQLGGNLYYAGVAMDIAGNLYVPDSYSNVIRKIDLSGIIHTITGTGTLGYSGDGGPAVLAQVYHPTFIVGDNMGGVIFADQNGDVLRRIDIAGIITSICKPSTTTATGDGGLLANATFVSISGLARDNAGNIYVSDNGNNTIRKISTSGIVSTVAGNGTFGFSGDGGPATAAQLHQPYQVGVDNAGNIYIPDCINNRIRKVDASGIITTIAGDGTNGDAGDGGPAINASTRNPNAICVDNAGNIYISEIYRNRVRRIDATGTISAYAGTGIPAYSGDGGPAIAATLDEPMNILADNTGNLYIVDYFNYVLRKVSPCTTAAINLEPAGQTICSLDQAIFKTSATNYTNLFWEVNEGAAWLNLSDGGMYAGTTTNTLTVTGANHLMSGYQYRCIAYNSCGPLATSPALLLVTDAVDPSLSIVASATNICADAATVFTATPADGGTTPSYQWMKNGLPVGTDDVIYNDNALQNGDVISCQLTSDRTCLLSPTATSNVVTMTVTPILTPAVTVTPSANDVCSQQPVTFSTSITNGGATPNYKWFRNGVLVDVGDASYTVNDLQNSDAIFCQLVSSYSCVTDAGVFSNTVTMHIIPVSTPAIAIQPDKIPVCPGKPITFNAAISNGGTTPLYQWEKNGVAIGGNISSYIETNPAAGDVIGCMVTSDAACLTTPSAISNTIPVALYPQPVVSLDQSGILCTGAIKLLDAGSFSSYLWNDGSTGRTFPVSDIGTYSVMVTDHNGCTAGASATFTTVLSSPSGFLPGDTSMCTYGTLTINAVGGYENYLWSDGSDGASITLRQPGVYSLQVTDDNGCQGKESITVAKKDCLQGFFIPNAFSPNHDGNNDTFKPQLFGNITKYQFAVYDRWGRMVFQSTNPGQGWDGGLNGAGQNSNVFVWMCAYQFDNGPLENKKGTVVLVR